MKLSRQVGTVSEVLNVFARDATNSSGAGLLNVIGSNVTFAWWHNDQAAATTGTASTAGSMGIYSTSAWVQINSTLAGGWYQFGVPDGIFASGRSAALHLAWLAGGMAPLPLEIELTKTNNQQYDSSKVFLAFTSTSPANIISIVNSPAVTSAAGILTVSTQALQTTTNANLLQIYGSPAVTSGAGILTVSTQTLSGGAGNITQVHGQTIVTSAAGVFDVNLIRILNSAAVTSGPGILTVSTQTLSAGAGDITSVYGSPIVTSGAGIINVSTQTIDKTGYFTAGTSFANLIQIYSQPAVTSGSGILTVSTQQLAAAGSDILTVYGSPIVTSGAGIFQVSTQTLTVPDNAGIANISSVVNNPLAESYRANGATGTIAQLMYEMIGHMGEVAITGTTKTVNSLDHVTPAETFQLDNSSAPSAITRIT